MGEFWKRLALVLALIGFIVSFGTIGYIVIERWSFLDSMYMTITTLPTVGYSEIRELSDAGKWFTITLIIGGVGTMLYALGTGAKFILEGELQEV